MKVHGTFCHGNTTLVLLGHWTHKLYEMVSSHFETLSRIIIMCYNKNRFLELITIVENLWYLILQSINMVIFFINIHF